MKKNMKIKVLGTALAAICALSAGAAISCTGANAAVVPHPPITTGVQARNCTMTFKGSCDWDYRANSKAALISCTYNSSKGGHVFTAKGNYAGNTDAVLKYKTTDGKWHNVPVRFTVDRNMNVTGQQTAREYITADRYSG